MTLQEKINHAVYQFLYMNTEPETIDRGNCQYVCTRFFGTKPYNINNDKDHEERITRYSKDIAEVIQEVIKNHIES